MKEFYNLDFDTLKDDIKTFMSTLPDFLDYNFEGSAASQLIDVLAYTTQHSAFYLNQTLNEFFMQTAQLTDNIYKIAHSLNYLPNRKSTSYLVAQFKGDAGFVGTITIPKFTKFSMGDIFLINVEEIIIVNEIEQDIILYEGEPIEELFDSDGTVNQIYELSYREQIDNDYFYVYVDTPTGGGGYNLGIDPWINLMKDSFDTLENAFYVRYMETFKVAFDSGDLFNKPENGDRVRVIYLKTNGTINNGLTGEILLITTGIGNSEHLLVTTTETTKNGVDEESINEIKNRAPLFYVTQNRAVTEKDHNIIAKRYSKYNIFADVVLWGGEREKIDIDGDFCENCTLLDVGHVYLTALKTNYHYLDDQEILDYIEFLNKQKFVSIFMKFIHPGTVRISPTINISFKNVLDINISDIENQINEYLVTKEGFNKNFLLSDLIAYVNSIDDVEYNFVSITTSILSVLSNPKSIRVNGIIIEGSINATIDGHSLSDSGGILYHDGSPCGTVNYDTGWIYLTTSFTDIGTRVYFEYVDKEKIALERENFLRYDEIILNSI